MERFQVDSPFFKYNKLTLRPAGIFKGIQLYHDNKLVKLKRGKAVLKDDNGVEREVVLSRNPYDHLWVKVEGTKYFPMGQFTSLERVFVFLPLFLLGIGGAIGGGLGAFASITNSSLIREYRDSAPLKYGLCLVTTLLATTSWYFLAIMLNTALK